MNPARDLQDDLQEDRQDDRQGDLNDQQAPSSVATRAVGQRLNWLRAGVLGANDGIVSTAGLVVGVAAADPSNSAAIATAGVAGLLAGAVSMALGEYVSVSTQRDMEQALVHKEQQELLAQPQAELRELVQLYRQRGLSAPTAERVAREMTAKDPLAAHLRLEAGIDSRDLTNPWYAAGASATAFSVGATLPLAAALLASGGQRIAVIVAAVLLALACTGWLSARLGDAPRLRAILRSLIGGGLAMGVTWAIGSLFHVAG